MISDIVCLLKTQDQGLVLIKVQYKVDEGFLAPVIECCLSLKEEYSQSPLILTVTAKGFPSGVKPNLTDLVNHYVNRINCDFWVKRCKILSDISIGQHLIQSRLNKLAILG